MVSGLCENQTLQNLALARLWALGSARLWAELRRLWARGSGAPNPFFLVARNCPSNASNPSNPSNASTLAMVVPYVWILDASDAPWTLQTLQNLALARLWALGSARIRRSKTSHLPDCGLWALRDCGRSCAGCGLGALARQIPFLVARNCPSNASNSSTSTNTHIRRLVSTRT